MKNRNQMKMTDSVTLRLSSDPCEAAFSDACTRFCKSASVLPPAASLGMRFTFSRDALPSVTVFSDAALTAEDYEWIFQPCAEIISGKAEDARELTETKTYLIAGNGWIDTEDLFGLSCLVDELCALGAALDILLPARSDRAYVSLEAAREAPLCVRVMLSSYFSGAEVLPSESGTNAPEEGVPCEVASENIRRLLTAIAEKGANDGMEASDAAAERLAFDGEGYSAPIDDLDLSIRSLNCLKRAGVHTIAQLSALDPEDLTEIRNLSERNIEEILQKLHEYRPAETEVPVLTDARSGREMLDELIGLEEVKTQVRRITALAGMQQDMKEKGLHAQPVTLNMAFVGNPGTAKTTVARIMAKILCEAGLIRNPQPIEVGRADIVGRYVGQTADRVKEIFRKARGGLLFIDEAYSLLDEWENSFGDEAINTIVQEMENCRDDTVVVFAGYPGPMEEFLSRNAGLRSRVPFHVNFADYSAEEMAQIAVLTAGQRGFSVHPQAAEKLKALCEEARNDPESGNGRFCRNLVENAILSFADRHYGDNRGAAEIDYVLLPEDFSLKLTAKKEKNRVGFFC